MCCGLMEPQVIVKFTIAAISSHLYKMMRHVFLEIRKGANLLLFAVTTDKFFKKGNHSL
jgi:hypothetical protein